MSKCIGKSTKANKWEAKEIIRDLNKKINGNLLFTKHEKVLLAMYYYKEIRKNDEMFVAMFLNIYDTYHSISKAIGYLNKLGLLELDKVGRKTHIEFTEKGLEIAKCIYNKYILL